MNDLAGAVTELLIERPPNRDDQEIEVKFKTDPEGLERALNSVVLAPASTPQIQNLRTKYFDTPSGELRKKRDRPSDSESGP